MKIFLLYGGKSAEHDISIISAYHILQEIYYDYYQVVPVYITADGEWIKGQVIETTEDVPSLPQMRKIEGEPLVFTELQEENCVIFPVLHGPNGEDGTVQGLFETLNVPYVGAGVLASSAGMDKIVSKILFKDAGIPIVPFETVRPTDWETDQEGTIQRVVESLSYPMYVKPANLGSSVGISEAKDAEELVDAINLAFEYDHRVLVEKGVIAREVEVAVLGNEDVHTSVVGALIKEISVQLREYATKAFIAIDGSGLSRVDFFVTQDNDIYINEINTFPGFTPISMYPKLWEETGLAYGDLIEELIQLAVSRHEQRTTRYGKQR